MLGYVCLRGRQQSRPGRTKMARFARTALCQAQTTAVILLCGAASMALPLALALIGFHSA
jgi:hypothetical protein